MEITVRLLAFLSVSSLLLHTGTCVCVPRPNGTNPLYPFLGDTVPAPQSSNSPKQGAPAFTPAAAPSDPSKDAGQPQPLPLPLPLPLPRLGGPISALLQGAALGICKHTDNPDLCFSSIKGELVGLRGAVDAAAILGMQIKATAQQTQLARALSVHVATAPGTPKMATAILQTCTDSYDDALDNLDAATSALATRDKGTLNSMLSAAMTDYTTCEEGFVETPGISSPMGHLDDMLNKLASNCLAIAELLK